MGVKDLSDEEFDVYSRQIALEDIGYDGQLSLRRAKVCIIGVGGLGCPSALKLAAMGVGKLRLVDRDVVSRSDLHRQYLYDVESVGLPKVEAAARRLSKLSPNVEVETIPESLSPRNARELVRGMDVVLDGLDMVRPRSWVNKACVDEGVTYLFGAAIEMFGNASTIIPGKTPCLECFYSGLSDESLDRCAIVGVHPSVLAIISASQVAEAVSILMGKEPQLAGKLFYVDLRNFSFDTIQLARSQKCDVCGEGKGLEVSSEARPVEGGCGRDGRGVFTVLPPSATEVDIQRLAKRLDERGIRVGAMGNLGITFDYNDSIKLSVLKSGLTIMQVSPKSRIRDEGDALAAYRRIASEISLPNV